ncbi:hypothetical protein JB92DRAFT_3083220 [Gautieria morchelliformis]|nr:hypothetical protein JB92DRAFT_3083220 [Gautieria morchelliformis]
MPGHNEAGKNGVDNGTWPLEEDLKASLLQYAKESLSIDQRLHQLQDEHGLHIKRCTLLKLQKKHSIPTVWKPPPPDQAAQLILNKVAADTSGLNGAGHHTELTSMGVFAEVCCDGHDEGNALGLQLGPVNLPIYGFRCKWSGVILHLVVVPNDRLGLATTIGHVFLDLVDAYKAIPLKITVDKGSETGEMFAMQSSLRRNYAPGISENEHPPMVFLKSIHNTTIEGIWHWLHANHEASSLFNWLWPPICQAILNDFVAYWNSHRIQTQHNKLMPSGATPRDVITSPQAYGGEHCSILVPQDAIDALCKNIPINREEALNFCDEHFSNTTDGVWNDLNSPPCTVSNGWEIFTKMLPLLSASGH